jgi:hypothetical protein
LATEKLAWQAGTPSKPWQNVSFPDPPRFVKPSKIKSAPPKIREMLLKKEMGTAKVILGAISFLRYSLASGPEGLCPGFRLVEPTARREGEKWSWPEPGAF